MERPNDNFRKFFSQDAQILKFKIVSLKIQDRISITLGYI
jgi:hypothetical protein